MAAQSTTKQPVFTEGYVIMPYKYSVGSLASKFFIQLRDNKKINGVKCPACNIIIVPPRSVCIKCFNKIDELVKLSGNGTLVTYTIVHFDSPVQASKPPYAIGVIKLDGADTCLTHFLGDVDFQVLKTGLRVEPVFSENRNGNILDIKYFKPSKT